MDESPTLMLSTAPFFRQSLRSGFEHARAAGFEAVEVMVTQDPATQDPETMRRLAKEFGLQILSLHAPFLLITRRVWGTDPVAKIRRSVQVAAEVGIPLVVVHPPYRWQRRYRTWAEDHLAEYAARTGVIVGVENMFPVKIRGERGVRFHASQDFDDLDRYPSLVLDTSHLAVSGFDLVETYERYQGKVVHFHVSNNAGKGWDSHLPVDEGVLPVHQLLDRIGRDFPGSIALELDLRRFLADRDTTIELLERNRLYCEEHLGVPA